MEANHDSLVSSEESGNNQDLKIWQSRLLPLIKRIIIGLCVFFFVATLGQLIYLQTSINNAPKIDLSSMVTNYKPANQMQVNEFENWMQLKSTILLEENTMERRHHQANVLLMSSIWIRYLGFVTGMILAFIGAAFILGKFQEQYSEFGAKLPSADFTLKSSSPGMLLAVLGSLLMVLTIVMQHTINVNDADIYFHPGTSASVTSGESSKITIHFPQNMDSSKNR